LYITQEEADTRMILQALHADKSLKELGKQGRIIIKTSDADVIYFDKQMTNTSELWVQMGNVSSVKDGRRVLPGAHALSGCNTTGGSYGCPPLLE
jgi:predicted phosphatase